MNVRGGNMNSQKPVDVKVGVKPVFASLIHSSAYEGPCRVGRAEDLDPTTERARAKEAFNRFIGELENLAREAKILKPAYVEHGDDWIVKEKEFEKLESDFEEVDLYLVAGCSLNQFLAAKVGEQYKKPVAMVGGESDGNLPMGCDAVSHLRAKHLEGYIVLDYAELNHLISLLRVRKAVSQTKVLRVTENKFDNVNGNFWDLENFKMKFGIDHKDICIKELVDEMDRVTQSKDEQDKAENIADILIKNAQRVHMAREYVVNDVKFYLTVKNLMAEYGCNAFTVNCFELCPDKRAAYDRKTTSCLTHTLLKDEGIPSACEGDINALLTIMVLIYISKKSVYMGNIFMRDKAENIVGILHDVPGIKMKGSDKPDLSYEIRNFTVGGWGTTIRYGFSQSKGEEVTVARFDPSGDKILVAKGKIGGGGGFDTIGCSLEALIRIPDVVSFFHKAADFGNHSAMVYGDYTQQLKELGDLMDFEVVEVV